MKQIQKMSRLTGELEKAFRLLNAELFDNSLELPIITVIPTPRAYAHYTTVDVWNVDGNGKREINIASGTLDRPLENILASLVHEMCHYYCDTVLNVQDTSNKGVYHNKVFKREAESHGLIVTRSDKYGWSHTEPADRLLQFVLDHDELREIEMCRSNPMMVSVGIGTHTGNSNGVKPIGTTTSHHRKYVCPVCGCSCRATKVINIACLDCGERMIEA